MRPWECECGRLNPFKQTKCLSCKRTSPHFVPKSFPPINFMSEKIKDIKKDMDNCERRMCACLYIDAVVRCLSPSNEVMQCESVLSVSENEIWMKTKDGNACLVFDGKNWAGVISRVVPKKVGGVFPLMQTGNPPAGTLEESKSSFMQEPMITVESGKEKTKYVKAELFERALTMWLNERGEKCINKDVKDHLTDMFSDVFPEISFQQVGNRIVLL